jgi:cysteine desulfurase
MERIRGYFDFAATGLPDPELYRVFNETAFSFPANPSSIHKAGLAAGKRLELARSESAALFKALPEQIVFTSGGTESNNIVVTSFLGHSPGAVLCPATEHASVYEPVQVLCKAGWTLQSPRLDTWGRIGPQDLEEALTEQTRLVCLMAVNNETGLIQDIAGLTAIIRRFEEKQGRKIHVHCDAVQAAGKAPLDPVAWNVDSLSLSSHKIGAPHGTGLLYLNRLVEPLYRGGGQEDGLRPGTHNLSGIAAFVEGLKRLQANQASRIQKLNDLSRAFLSGLNPIRSFVLLPSRRDATGPFAPSIINISNPAMPAEVSLRLLSDRGFFVSAGAACSGKKSKKTRILAALGIAENLAQGALRISFDDSTQLSEIHGLLKALAGLH